MDVRSKTPGLDAFASDPQRPAEGGTPSTEKEGGAFANALATAFGPSPEDPARGGAPKAPKPQPGAAKRAPEAPSTAKMRPDKIVPDASPRKNAPAKSSAEPTAATENPQEQGKGSARTPEAKGRPAPAREASRPHGTEAERASAETREPADGQNRSGTERGKGGSPKDAAAKKTRSETPPENLELLAASLVPLPGLGMDSSLQNGTQERSAEGLTAASLPHPRNLTPSSFGNPAEERLGPPLAINVEALLQSQKPQVTPADFLATKPQGLDASLAGLRTENAGAEVRSMANGNRMTKDLLIPYFDSVSIETTAQLSGPGFSIQENRSLEMTSAPREPDDSMLTRLLTNLEASERPLNPLQRPGDERPQGPGNSGLAAENPPLSLPTDQTGNAPALKGTAPTMLKSNQTRQEAPTLPAQDTFRTGTARESMPDGRLFKADRSWDLSAEIAKDRESAPSLSVGENAPPASPESTLPTRKPMAGDGSQQTSSNKETAQAALPGVALTSPGETERRGRNDAKDEGSDRREGGGQGPKAAMTSRESSPTEGARSQPLDRKFEAPDDSARALTQSTLERVRQNAARLSTQGGGTARIQINDAKVGQMDLEVRVGQGNTVHVEIKSRNSKLRGALEERIDDLKESLGQHKLQLAEFKVVSEAQTTRNDADLRRDGQNQPQAQNSQQGGQESRNPQRGDAEPRPRAEVQNGGAPSRGKEKNSSRADVASKTNVQRGANGSLKITA